MLRTILNAGALACEALLAGCGANVAFDTPDYGHTQAELVGAAGTEPLETKATTEISEEMELTSESREALTKWQQLCIIGCAAFSNGGCAAVSASCTAGALWSFGGILIPCSYAMVAACAGAGVAGVVCTIKCTGG